MKLTNEIENLKLANNASVCALSDEKKFASEFEAFCSDIANFLLNNLICLDTRSSSNVNVDLT